ncbi:AraC family transcriptional regulator [Atopomonas sediminilitoris]|uniref:AraC family transcriptional regulator n=1 Tax=Atopomonas sediminilitoris TaxID=2919919 RepID=UPI001F4E027D|nr:AraC family transcriptional regulator [Atopomonas sediminilitoris]MCJ8170155.1 AraC family transcriptional regulator [Atopomonas sediminilitoris]
MSKHLISQWITSKTGTDGLFETCLPGVQLFHISAPRRCAPAVYEPAVVAIVSGTKEAIVDGTRYRYDNQQYLCCSLSMPVEAGIHRASADNPLIGVYIPINIRLMTDLVIELHNSGGDIPSAKTEQHSQGLALAHWDDAFAEALLRLLQLNDRPADAQVLAEGRLRELYYAVLQGEAGRSARQAFGVGNAISRVIAHVSTHLEQPVNIEAMADMAGMSRAVFHRKFKQATQLSPIQFIKAMRLNTAATQIAAGMTVSAASLAMGYASSSQFSREFKRLYGQSPRQWSEDSALAHAAP